MYPHVVPVESICLVPQRSHEQPHEHRNLLLRPLPIFGRERVEGKILNPELTTTFHRIANRFDAFIVTCDAGERSFLCPASIPIHNDGDMDGDIPLLELF